MIVKFRDNTETTINEERGDNLESLLMSGQAPEYIKINDIVVRKDYIVKIMPGGQYNEIDESKVLYKPDHRGKHSTAKEELRKKWGK